MLLQQIYKLTIEKYSIEPSQLSITEVVFGMHLLAVKLSDGTMGVASVINDHTIHQVEKKERDFGVFSPLKIPGNTLVDLFETEKNTPVISMLRVASLNAVFQGLLKRGAYKSIIVVDPVSLVNIADHQHVVMVGAFNSYIKQLAQSGTKLTILELNADAVSEAYRHLYVPAQNYKQVLPQASLVIISGLTIVNDTISELLANISPGCKTILLGPSASMPPDWFFEHSVQIVGSLRITNPEVLMNLVSQGAAGYHLYEYCAEKITLLND